MFVRAVGRVAGVAFRPATALTGRLRYAQKFVVVGLVLVAPLRYPRCLGMNFRHKRPSTQVGIDRSDQSVDKPAAVLQGSK